MPSADFTQFLARVPTVFTTAIGLCSLGSSIAFGRSLRHLVNALAELEAVGVAFVSLRDNLDLTTPAGRLMFQIIGAMAEFERALIQERVKAGLRNARAKGKRLGRPRVFVTESKVESLRASGASWRTIAQTLGIGVGTAHRAAERRAKIACRESFEPGPDVIHF